MEFWDFEALLDAFFGAFLNVFPNVFFNPVSFGSDSPIDFRSKGLWGLLSPSGPRMFEIMFAKEQIKCFHQRRSTGSGRTEAAIRGEGGHEAAIRGVRVHEAADRVSSSQLPQQQLVTATALAILSNGVPGRFHATDQLAGRRKSRLRSNAAGRSTAARRSRGDRPKRRRVQFGAFQPNLSEHKSGHSEPMRLFTTWCGAVHQVSQGLPRSDQPRPVRAWISEQLLQAVAHDRVDSNGVPADSGREPFISPWFRYPGWPSIFV